jgi:hypothetical protein
MDLMRHDGACVEKEKEANVMNHWRNAIQSITTFEIHNSSELLDLLSSRACDEFGRNQTIEVEGEVQPHRLAITETNQGTASGMDASSCAE